jgi:two-component system chemotaxis sensor kinase CheA
MAPTPSAPAFAPPAPAAAPEPAAPRFEAIPQPAVTTPGPSAMVHADAEHQEEKSTSKAAVTHADADGTVRVNVGVLDKLMNLMGELVLARNQMVQIVRNLRDNTAQGAAQRLSQVTSDLQEQIMKTRMQPVARVFEKIPRMVRDLCQQTGKRLAVEIEGTATELDKALVEAIRDPVMHIVRNAVDHGVETPAERVAAGKPASGKLVVRANHEGSTVTVEVRDDGRGIDPAKVKAIALQRGVISQSEAERMSEREAIELIFRPGFSTAEKVTSISGRGVGMDVVRTHVERAGGQVELESRFGRGTTIRMKMPLTLAIIPALLVRDGDHRFAIPQANLLELVYLDEDQIKKGIETIRGAPIYRLRGEILPLVRLSPLLRKKEGNYQGGVNIVVVSLGQRRYGLVVESIHDTEEIVIKPLHSMLKRLPCYAGATVLGDGGVALILDVAGIASMAGIDLSAGRRSETQDAAEVTTSSANQSMLIFAAGEGVQCAVPVSMVARLEQVDATSIERIAGSEVLQYRDEIMPIIRPESILPIGMAPPLETGVQQLLVFNFGKPVGMAVNAILDVSEIDTPHPSDVPNVLCKAVVFDKTTLVIDVFGVIKQLAPKTIEDGAKLRAARPRVLLADELDAMRASLAGFLRAAGMDVVEVGTDALVREVRNNQSRQFDAVVAGVDRQPARGIELVKSLRTEQPELPLVCVSREEELNSIIEAAGARACVRRVEREAVLEALITAGIFKSNEANRS